MVPLRIGTSLMFSSKVTLSFQTYHAIRVVSQLRHREDQGLAGALSLGRLGLTGRRSLGSFLEPLAAVKELSYKIGSPMKTYSLSCLCKKKKKYSSKPQRSRSCYWVGETCSFCLFSIQFWSSSKKSRPIFNLSDCSTTEDDGPSLQSKCVLPIIYCKRRTIKQGRLDFFIK